MGFNSQLQQLSGSSLLNTTIGGEGTIAVNVNNLGENEEEMSNSSSSLTVHDMMTGKQQKCIADTTPCSGSATALPPPAGFQRLMGHYTRTMSIGTDITRDDGNSPGRNLDIEEKNIVCYRCNGLVAGPFFLHVNVLFRC